MKTKKLLVTFLIAIAGGFVAVYINSFFNQKEAEIILLPQNEKKLSYVNTSLSENFDFTYAAAKTVNSVVHVKTKYYYARKNSNWDNFLFKDDQERTPIIATGSGVIISTDGYIVTNNHVISKSNKIEVVLNDKRTYEASVVGTDPSTDLALIKIKETNLPSLPLGNSDDLKIGEWVLAVGNPFNLTSTVTAGIVSAKGRNINLLNRNYAIESFIQTDAVVNKGNSGGALVNTKGELVGINTAIASLTGSYSGYSFAVPVNIVKKIVSDLKEFGTVQRAVLGINISEVNSNLAKKLNLNKIEGVYVVDVLKDGSAETSGIKRGDIILKINDTKVNKVSELQEQVSKFRPGNKIKVVIKRNGKEIVFDITLRNLYGNTDIVNKDLKSILGATFSNISKEEKEKLNIKNGIKVVDIKSGKLFRAGVQKNFIIVYINRKPVDSYEDLQKVINSARGGIYIEGIYPNGKTAYYAFGLK